MSTETNRMISKDQADKMVELQKQGWVTVAKDDPLRIGGPEIMQDPQGKQWIVNPDGSVTSRQ